MEFVLNGNISRSHNFAAEKYVTYPGLNGNCPTRKWKKPLYGKYQVFRNPSFTRILGILYILQNCVSSNCFNSAFNDTALPAMKFN
jgi:hypothetical protein